MLEIFAVIGAVASMLAILGVLIKAGQWLWRRMARPDPEVLLEHKLARKRELEECFPGPDENGVSGEAIIRNVQDSSPYPNGDETRRGIRPSNWFEVDVKGLYPDGLEVFVGELELLQFDAESESWMLTDDRAEPVVFGRKVGQIPFERIRKVDPDGDDYKPVPHIYCTFNGRLRMPYEKFIYYCGVHGQRYWDAIDDFRPWESEFGLLKRIFLSLRLWLNV